MTWPMTWEEWAPLGVFLLIAQITPGPNNTLLLTAGAAGRLKPAMGMVAGITLSLTTLQFFIALGLGAAFETLPILRLGLTIVGSGLLGLIAWRLWRADPATPARPASGLEMAAFQFVNPKAWMLMTAAVAFLPNRAATPEAIAVAASVCAIAILTGVVWISMGIFISGALRVPARRRMFNRISAGLIAALIPFLWR